MAESKQIICYTRGVIEARYYTITELSELLGMSFERFCMLVKDEPGVIRLPRTGEKSSRPGRRTMYRIPASVVEWVLRRHTNI